MKHNLELVEVCIPRERQSLQLYGDQAKASCGSVGKAAKQDKRQPGRKADPTDCMSDHLSSGRITPDPSCKDKDEEQLARQFRGAVMEAVMMFHWPQAHIYPILQPRGDLIAL